MRDAIAQQYMDRQDLRRSVSAFASRLRYPTRASFALPANANLAVRPLANVAAGVALTVNGRNIRCPALSAGEIYQIGYFERGRTIAVSAGFDLLLHVGLGRYEVIRSNTYSPLEAFAGQRPGVWLDPSDMSTMFADTAGTIPITLNTPVALMFDKSSNRNHVHQPALASRPILRQALGRNYLDFDGIDDFVISQSVVRMKSLSQVTVCVGVRRDIQTFYGHVAEMSSNLTGVNGAWAIFSPSSARWEMRLKGNAALAQYQPMTYTAPIISVLSLVGDLTQASVATKFIPRVNKVIEQENVTGSTIGVGPFTDQLLYIGRRGGTTNPLDGRIYGLMFTGAALSGTTLTELEDWMNGKTGAY